MSRRWPPPKREGRILEYERGWRPECPPVPDGFRRVVGNDHRFESAMPDCEHRFESSYQKRACGALVILYTCLSPECPKKGTQVGEVDCSLCKYRPGNENTPPSEEDGVDEDEERYWRMMEIRERQ